MKKFLALFLTLGAAVSAQVPNESTGSLWEQMVIYRDGWGVPHVYADNPRAMAFGFGYAQAEDHLEAMLLAYREANGRASEVLGERMVESDEFAIKVGHADLAYEAYELADWLTRDLCEGFAQGVNSWIMDNPSKAPDWAEGVHAADVLALMHRYQTSMAPFDEPDIFHMEPGTPSANAWAVAPSMSKNGDPMLVINPHADYDSPFKWYEAHLSTRDMDVYGATLFGLPVILQGHNESLGWALSPNKPDIADIYVEYPHVARKAKRGAGSMMKTPPISRYSTFRFTRDEYRPYYVFAEDGFDERGVRRLQTARGPVVGQQGNLPLTWRIGGYQDFGAIRQLYDMGRAQDLQTFRDAVDRQQLSSFHVIYADHNGNIWYQYNATLANRPEVLLGNADDSTVLPGGLPHSAYEKPVSTYNGVFEWQGIIAPGELPSLLNPDAGYLQACGTPPWLVNDNTGIAASNWSEALVRDVDSYRAKRVRRLFALGPRSFHDVQSMLFDTVSPLAAEAVPYLLRAANEQSEWVAAAHPDLTVGLDMLRDWNYLADTDSMAMTFFHVWWSVLRVSPEGYTWPPEVIHGLIQENEVWFREHVVWAAEEAAKLLRNEFQTMNIPWGEVHVLRRGRREVPVPGSLSGEPLFASSDRRFENGKWIVDGGTAFAMAVQFGKTPKAVSLVPFGNSEDPESPHFDDQLDLLQQRRFKVARYLRGDVERHAVSAIGQYVLLRPRQGNGSVMIQADAPIRARLNVADRMTASPPPGLAVFSTFMEPVIEPGRTSVVMDMELRVPKEVCAASTLEELAVYGYHPVVGWSYVEEQDLDWSRRTFLARVYESQVYVVLGPANYRKAVPGSPATRLAREADALPDNGSRNPFLPPVREEVAPEQNDTAKRPLGESTQRQVTAVARNSDADLVELSPADRRRAAELFPPNPTLDDQGRETTADLAPHVRRGPRLVPPALPPGWRPARDTRPFTPPAQGAPHRSGGGAGGGASPANVAAKDGSDQGNVPLLTNREAVSPARELPEAQAPAVPQPPSEPRDEPTGKAPIEVAQAPAGPLEALDAEEKSVTWSGLTPRELLGSSGPRAQEFYLAPDPARASEMLIGTDLELRPPSEGTRFQVRTDKTIRVQAFMREELPGPLPEGLVAFSPVYEILHSPPVAVGSTVMFIKVRPGSIRADEFASLELYVFDPGFGWVPLPRQKSDATAGVFSALDGGLRTYAVLGPAGARQ